MNTQAKIVIALMAICLVLTLFKTQSSTNIIQPPIIRSEVKNPKPTEKLVTFEDENIPALKAIKPGMAITAPEDIDIEEDDCEGHFLSDDKTYYFSVWLKPKNTKRIIKKGTKLVVTKVVTDTVTMAGGIRNSSNSTVFKVSTLDQKQSFYVSIVASDRGVYLYKHPGYYKYSELYIRNVTIGDILKYSDVLEIPEAIDLEIIK